MADSYFTVGRLVNTQGTKGEARVISETDFPEQRYKIGQTLYLFHPSAAEPIPLEIASSRQHKNFYLLTFKGVTSINEVEKYKGGILKVRGDEREPLEEGEFYFQDIIGCQVYTEEGEKLGLVEEILQPGANDVWVVKPEKGKDILIPYIEDVVKEINIAQKRIVVHLLPGLI
ncbi:ribosome maturation factor RimM [Aneurinibacillus tyrosinisolvens]|uniref:ribosome maturation factor RimM n=1 Tax=Aneurinibacillus tyrosinisolvens TaxID=1443435 RepID=UPI00063F32F3|nr:ribosome maturation factor RimM [Aneurinibacillus tyrosinisolvens]